MGMEDDGTSDVLLKLLVDFPDQLLAFGDVGLLGLLIEQLLDIGVAVIGVVSLRIAGVVLVEGLVRIVDRVSGEVEAERIILARNFREPVGGLDDVEISIDIDALELIDQDDGGVAIDRNVAGRNLDLQMLVRTVAG